MAVSEPLHIVSQRWSKSPFGLGAESVRLRRFPSRLAGSMAPKVGFDAVSAVHHLLCRGAAQRPELEDVPVAASRGRPRESAFHHHDGPARGETLAEETLVRLAEGPALEPEVAHTLDHQPILHGILHVVQLEVRVVSQNQFGMALRPAHFLTRLVRVNARAPYGYQKRLGQPGDTEGGPQMDGGTIGRSDHDGRILSPRIEVSHPRGNLFAAHGCELSRRRRFHPSAPDVDLLLKGGGQAIDRRRDELHERHPRPTHGAEEGEAFPPQRCGEGAEHACGRIEIGDVGDFLSHQPLTRGGTGAKSPRTLWEQCN